ncbi:MAG: TIGR03790 family protein [Kiritimatiellae bacterium]|nr:TIGR03790 family protein [Kiritimatiellia bacterium]
MPAPGGQRRARGPRPWRTAAALAAAALLPLGAAALGPHEVALVVNDASMESILLAQAYARVRAVPECNVVRVSLPMPEDGSQPVAMTRADFEEKVFRPVQRELDARGLSTQILAWVYSCGFPTRVAADEKGLASPGTKDLSVTGATFVRCVWPSERDVERGLYVSPLFAGPSEPGETPAPAQSFDQARNAMLEDMPLPASMLAWTGPRGIGLDDAIAALERSARGDCDRPEGTVWFAVSGDVRSVCRDWQFAAAAAAVDAHDVARAVVASNTPPATTGPLLGCMAGAADVRIPKKFVPGSFAEHLTSHAATFDRPKQTKAVKWMLGGAGFTSGTVAEPYALWQKFPNAWIFPRMLDGLTAMEAWYQSVRCPLQQVPFGDPLAKPWAPDIEPTVEGPGEDTLRGVVEFRASLPGKNARKMPRFTWLVDGRTAGSGSVFKWNTARWEDGPHAVRAVVRDERGGIRHQGFFEIAYFVDNGGAP